MNANVNVTQRDATSSGLAASAPVATWLGLLGPAWMYSPADPANSIPAADLNFAAMAAAFQSSPSSLQVAFFSWSAWVLAVLATVLAIAALRSSSRLVGGLCLAVGLIGFVISILAVKGTSTWSVLFSGIENVRLGAVLLLLGLLSLAGAGLRLLAGNRQIAENPITPTLAPSAS
ncbi:hypothetical protein [Rhodococcus koreensis]